GRSVRVSVVLDVGRRADGRDRKEAADRAEVSRSRSTNRDHSMGWEGPNVKRDQGTGTARAGVDGLLPARGHPQGGGWAGGVLPPQCWAGWEGGVEHAA